ncbi:MAG TPA: hypothetical protein VGA78_17625, partial [Gemmatimonadales bacterium]
MKLIPSVHVSIRIALLSCLAAPLAPELQAQAQQAVARLTAEPSSLRLRVGDSARITVKAYDAQGREIPDAQIRVFGARRTVGYQDGLVRAFRAGNFTLTAAAPGADAVPVMLEIPVTATWPAIAKLEIVPAPGGGPLYTGVTLAHSAKGYLADGTERVDLKPTWRSSND